MAVTVKFISTGHHFPPLSAFLALHGTVYISFLLRLASVWGGLKTLQTKEAFQGLATSLEQMTASVRGSLIETWNYSTELKDEELQRTSGFEGRGDGLDEGDSHGSLNDELGDDDNSSRKILFSFLLCVSIAFFSAWFEIVFVLVFRFLE